MRVVITILGALTAVVFGLFGLVVAAALGPPGSQPPTPAVPVGVDAGGGGTVAEIPAGLEVVYREAAAAYCTGLPWPVLAGIGWVESRHGGGRADPATGQVSPPIVGPAIDGRPGFAAIPDPTSPDGWAHARGPMQFLPSTWRRWATLAPRRPPGATPSADNAWDAIHGAARMLCGNRAHLPDLPAAVYGYNHDWRYVSSVFAKADDYTRAAATGGG